MPRNRMIKPAFWEDEKIATISYPARLLYIGLWNFSDDYGVVKGHPSWLKNNIFPYDDSLKMTRFKTWLTEIQKLERIIPFSANGESYFYIPKFLEHQKINRPSGMRNPEFNPELINTHGGLTEDSLPKEKEKGKEKGKGNEKENGNGEGERGGGLDCPLNEIIELYHEILPELPSVSVKNGEILSSELPSKIKRIWSKRKAYQDIEFWRFLFRSIRHMDLLMGKTKDFRASLFWIVGVQNFEKIINGNYIGYSHGRRKAWANALASKKMAGG